jgi:tetratricopeptide (TPR) repeat protein
MIRQLPIVAILTCAAVLGLALAGGAQSAASAIHQAPPQSVLKEYRAAIEANPNDSVAHIKLGNWYLQAGNTNAAISEYKKSTKLNEKDATAWNNLGSAYHAGKRYKDAVKCYRKATELQPDMAVAHRNLGAALLATSRLDEGVAAFRRALELSPAVLNATPDISISSPGVNALTQYYYFAKLSAEAGRIDSAIEFLGRARAAGFSDFQKVRQDPSFKSVVADARFEKIATSESK